MMPIYRNYKSQIMKCIFFQTENMAHKCQEIIAINDEIMQYLNTLNWSAFLRFTVYLKYCTVQFAEWQQKPKSNNNLPV